MEQKEILQRIAFPVERTSHFDKCGMSFDRGTILGPTTKLASCHWHCSRTWHSAHLPFQDSFVLQIWNVCSRFAPRMHGVGGGGQDTGGSQLIRTNVTK